MKIYNHMFDVAFSIDSAEDPYDVTPAELIVALEARIAVLKAEPNEAIEAFGYVCSYTKEEAK